MNLEKIQKKIDEFVESNNKDMLSTSEYYIYVANLLMAISIPIIAIDEKLSSIEPKDYFSVESAFIKFPDNPYLNSLIIAHKLIALSESFK